MSKSAAAWHSLHWIIDVQFIVPFDFKRDVIRASRPSSASGGPGDAPDKKGDHS